jgi:hypothetical protein
MIFHVFINPNPGVDRMAMYKEFEHLQSRDDQFKEAVGIQRTFKIVGRDEVYLIMRAENLLFLEQALSPFEKRADIQVTPVVELT